MIPLSGPRLVGSALLAAVGLVGAVATARPEPAVAAAPFVVAVLVGLVAGGRPSATAEVVASSTRAVAGDEIEVVATVRSSAAGHRAVARLRVPAELELVDGAPSVADLLARGRATFRWRLRAERWGGVGRLVVEVGVVDRMGMRRTEVTGASAPLRVLPDEAALRRILSPRSLRTIPGGHSSRHRGEGIEFADMRPFVPGDRARSVNWRASARRGELWVDERHPERSGEVVLFLDSFVAAGHGRDDTLRRTVELARAVLGRHVAANDRVGLVDLGGVFRWVRPGGGTVQLFRIAEALADTEVWASSADKPLEVLPVRALPRRSLVIGLSPLLDPRGVASFVRMRARGLDVAVIEVSPLAAVPPTPGGRGELAHRLWSLERAATRDELRRRGVGVTEWASGAPIGPVLDELLAYREAVSRWAR